MNYIPTFLASFLIWLMFFGLALLWIFRKELKAYQVIHVLAVVAVALLIAQVIKEIVPSPRPFTLNGSLPLTLIAPVDNSFPSSHTTAAFAMTFGLLRHNRRLGMFFFPPAVLVGYGRVLSNVHFPIDILGGILLALVISIIFGHRKLLRFFQKAWITS
jgi:undecaprenyl-diphosphatase